MKSREADPRAGNDWRWVAVAGAAIVLGGAIGFLLGGEGAAPPGNELTEAAPEAGVTATAPSPGRDEPVPILARQRHIPSPPQPPRADLPFARPAPGVEPVPQGNTAVRMDEMDRRLAAWTQVMRHTRPDVRQQLLEGQRQEQIRLRKRMDRLEEMNRKVPDASIRARLRKMQDELSLLERKIAQLEALEGSEP